MFGLSFWLLSGARRCLGVLCGLPAFAHIDKGRLSLCFKRNGNIFLLPRRSSQGLTGDCSGLFGDFRGLTEDLTLMSKNLFRVIFKTF